MNYGEDDFGRYWADDEYDLADARYAEQEARYKAQEPYEPSAPVYDQDAVPPYRESGLPILDLLSLSIWDLQLAKPNYSDWYLDTQLSVSQEA